MVEVTVVEVTTVEVAVVTVVEVMVVGVLVGGATVSGVAVVMLAATVVGTTTCEVGAAAGGPGGASVVELSMLVTGNMALRVETAADPIRRVDAGMSPAKRGATRTVGKGLVGTELTRRGTGAITSRPSRLGSTRTIDSVRTALTPPVRRALITSHPEAPTTGALMARARAVARVSGDFTIRRYDADRPEGWQSPHHSQPAVNSMVESFTELHLIARYDARAPYWAATSGLRHFPGPPSDTLSLDSRCDLRDFTNL